MKKVIVVMLLVFVSLSTAYAQEIAQDKFYRAKSEFRHLEEYEGNPNATPILKKGCTIKIIKTEDIPGTPPDKFYYFQKADTFSRQCTEISEGQIYRFKKTNRPDLYLDEWQSIVHGTLVVPFKLRTKDGRLMGDSTIGYYVGKQYEIWDLRFIPLISLGLSMITVPVNDKDNDTKAGITGAAGIILTHTGNFQMGVIAGLDHLGGDSGKNWRYENDPWVSFMIGYNFAQ